MKKNRCLILIFPALLLWSAKGQAFKTDTLRVAMRDSVKLATDVYIPTQGTGPWPTILVRTPYNRRSVLDKLVLTMLTDVFQYTLVLQNLRGKYGSEGQDSLFLSDGWGRLQDGYDTIEWIALQEWNNGKVGIWGASGYGIPGYFAAGSRPPHLTCCMIMVAAQNMYEDALFQGGVYRKSLVDGWLEENESGHLISYFSDHPNYEPLYDFLNLSTRYDSVNVPILHVGGWHDIFIQGQLNAFSGIQIGGGAGALGYQKLLVGPWVHYIYSPECGELSFPGADDIDLIMLTVNWMGYWLKDIDSDLMHKPPVTYYIMGDADHPEGPGNRWIETDTWPPESREVLFYLHEGGVLSRQIPSADEMPDAFDYDPLDPVPTIGGRNLSEEGGSYGSRDQRPVEDRPDVLVYTTDPLTDSLFVAGRVTVRLLASSDALDTDFSAKLSDVYPDGRSMLVADGIVQARHRNSMSEEELLIPGEIYLFEIDLWSTAIVFAPGHSIRVAVSSSNYPRFEANPNTGEPFRKHTQTVTAHQTVYHDAEHASALVLPVVGEGTTVLASTDALPDRPYLEQNYPNPFNAWTCIPIYFPLSGRKDGKARLSIYNLKGEKVHDRELDASPGETVPVRWHAEREGKALPSGIYVVRFTWSGIQETRKITLLR